MLKWWRQFKVLRDARGGSTSLRLRLLFFALLFVAILFIAVLIVLYATGVLRGNYEDSYVYFQGEADYISAGIADSLRSLETNALKLSQNLGEQLTQKLDEKDIRPNELQANPAELEDLLRSSMEPLISSLVNSRSSGVFLALDATVNPDIENAESSRAGLLLRNMMPNALDADSSIYYIRGPIQLAREKNMYVVAQWDMEITLADDYFRRTLKGASEEDYDLSRLVYLSPAITLPDDYNYQAILLCVPVIAPDGTPLGVCGYEIDSLFFKTLYKPKDTFFPHMLSLLAPVESGQLAMEHGLIAADQLPQSTGALTVSSFNEYFSRFALAGGQSYIGLERAIQFYPKGALHGSDTWALAVMVPESVMNGHIEARRQQVLLILFIFLLFSIAAAVAVGYGYFKPFRPALKQAKESGSGIFDSTHITELDELLAQISKTSSDAVERQVAQKMINGDSLTDIAQSLNLTSAEANRHYAAIQSKVARAAGRESREEVFARYKLTKREREVAVHLLDGTQVKNIPDAMGVASSTVSFHSKNLYRKLGVQSRSELFALFQEAQPMAADEEEKIGEMK